MSEAEAPPPEVDEFLTWLAAEQGRSINTVAAYRRDLRAYVTYLRAQPVDLAGVDAGCIERYVGSLRAAGRAPASVSRALVAIRSLHRFLTEEEIREDDPASQVAVPRVPKGIPKALSEDDVFRLLDVPGDDAVARRDRAMLEVLYGAGLRISELVGLSRRDLDLGDGLVRALGKGDRERIVPIGGAALDALEAWLAPGGRSELEPERWARRDDADAVFLNQRGGRLSRQGAWGVVRKHGRRCGLDDRLTPHVLRHSYATHLVDHGADIRAVQELLGHASVSTTQVYTLVSTERLWEVYRTAHPRARSEKG